MNDGAGCVWVCLILFACAAVGLQAWSVARSNDSCRDRGGQVIESYGSNGYSWGCLEKQK